MPFSNQNRSVLSKGGAGSRTPSNTAGRRRRKVETLAEYGVPVLNELTDKYRPTQTAADGLTMGEHSNKPIRQIS